MDEILLTGATGYLGGCVAEKALARGLRLHLLQGRLEHADPCSLDAGIVIHCAGALRYRRAELETTNHYGTRRLLQALRHPARIIYMSSRSVYAPGAGQAVDERAPTVPLDEYGWSKLRGEQAVIASGHQYLILRVPGLFGHGLRRRGISFPCVALERFLRGETVTLHVPDRLHDYLDVQTLADLLLDLAKPGSPWGRVFNVAGPSRSLDTTLTTIASVVERHTGSPSRIQRQPGPPPPGPLLSVKSFEAAFRPVNQPPDADVAADMLGHLLRAATVSNGLPKIDGASPPVEG